MLKDLIKLANHLDSRGLTKEADFLDRIIRKTSSSADSRLAEDVLSNPKNKIPDSKTLKEYPELVEVKRGKYTISDYRRITERFVLKDPSSGKIYADFVRKSNGKFFSNTRVNAGYLLDFISDDNKQIYDGSMIDKHYFWIIRDNPGYQVRLYRDHIKKEIDTNEKTLVFRHVSGETKDDTWWFVEENEHEIDDFISYIMRGKEGSVFVYAKPGFSYK
jgi:hypothetical protein